MKLPSLPWRVPLNEAILRLADEAQSLQVPVNQGMAPGARLVVVDVEKSNDPGVYKAWGFGRGTWSGKMKIWPRMTGEFSLPVCIFGPFFLSTPRGGTFRALT